VLSEIVLSLGYSRRKKAEFHHEIIGHAAGVFGRGPLGNPYFLSDEVHIKIKAGKIAAEIPFQAFHEESGNTGPEPVFQLYAASLKRRVGISFQNPVKRHALGVQSEKDTK